MKNYFTDEQIKELSYATGVVIDQVSSVTHEQIKALMNLAVDTAIGKPMGTVVGWEDEDGNMPVKWHDSPNVDSVLYAIKEQPNG